MILAGIIAALGLLFLVLKLGVKKVLGYDILIDIGITSLLMWSLAGTYSGMMAALIGGLIVSVILFAMRKTMPREELRLRFNKVNVYKNKATISIPKLDWVTINP
tara:strand:+ start:330 stop:644 length:315 start_codon:yes stop_codon:yes gene_type:complete